MYQNAENGLRLLLQIINILMHNPPSRIQSVGFSVICHLKKGFSNCVLGMLQGDWGPQNIWEKKYFV